VKAVFNVDVRKNVQDFLRKEISDAADLVFTEELTKETVVRTSKGAEIIVGSRFVGPVLEASQDVRLVQIPWAGVQNVVDAVRSSPDVLLANSHDNARATAQYAVSMLLCLLNRLVPAHMLVMEGRWVERREFPTSIGLRGKTVGILGAGHIGREVARLVSAFEVEVLGLRRRVGEMRPLFSRLFMRDELHEFLREIDALFITLPSTPETVGIIGPEELDLIGSDGYLVNVGRGELVQEEALFLALKENSIAGAAIDVWYDYEPVADKNGRAYPFRFPFYECDNIFLSPHRAGQTPMNPECWVDVVENINRFVAGRTDLLNMVDLEAGY
jgi:phosphoglycerate dehydrogenase-like enzyme